VCQVGPAASSWTASDFSVKRPFLAPYVRHERCCEQGMAKLGHRFWLSSVLLTAVAFSVAACGDDEDATQPLGGAGAGGSGGKQPIGGQAGSAEASAGDAGNAGSAGQGGEAACVEGLRVVKVIEDSTDSIISWPAVHRVAVRTFGQGILIYELGDDGEVTLVETLGPDELGLGADGAIYSLTRYGEGFLVQGSTNAEPRVHRIVNWQPDAELETVPYPDPGPPAARLSITAADPEIGIAAASSEGVRVATFASDTWTWSEPFATGSRRSSPLALASDRVLVGVEEVDRLAVDDPGNEGGAAAGGAAAGGAGGGGGEGGGADVPTNSPHARVEWWNLQGERLETHEAVGNPQVAVKVAEGWLIGETNSFWGSYQAGIELLPNTGALHKLTDVRVTSAGDGTDGAFDLALLGQRLFVANCESGLRVGDWSTSSLTLSSLPGPWQDGELGDCSPIQVETLDDFAVIGGQNVVFARACE